VPYAIYGTVSPEVVAILVLIANVSIFTKILGVIRVLTLLPEILPLSTKVKPNTSKISMLSEMKSRY